MSETIINGVLKGSINVNNEGVVEWRYLDEEGNPQYMRQAEFADFFNDIITQIQKAANSWKDEVCQSTR